MSDTELSVLARVKRNRVARLYPGIDTNFYRPSEKSDLPSAITIGQLTAHSIQRKGIDTSIRAVAKIRQAVPEFRLFVVGPLSADGEEYLAVLRSQIDFSGVEICGFVTRERKRDLLASSWAYLQPSKLEGFGVAVAEAMATGTVPICSNRGSLPEVVDTAGVILSTRTPSAVAQQTIALLLETDRRKRLELTSRTRAVECFGRNVRLHDMRELLQRWHML